MDLRVPAFSLAEAGRTLNARHQQRIEFAREINRQANRYSGTAAMATEVTAPLRSVRDALTGSTVREWAALSDLRGRLLDAGTVLPTDKGVMRRALDLEEKTDLDPSDATVFAAILEDLPSLEGRESRFVTTNESDFFEVRKEKADGSRTVGPPKPVLLEQVEGTGCRIVRTFAGAAGWASTADR